MRRWKALALGWPNDSSLCQILCNLSLSFGAAADGQDAGVTPWPPRFQMRWTSRQTSLLRFNCADSLDRTNAASYFAAVQVSRPFCAVTSILSLGMGTSCADVAHAIWQRDDVMQALVEQARRIDLVLEGDGLAQRATVRSLQGHRGNILSPAATALHSATGLSEEPSAPGDEPQRPVRDTAACSSCYRAHTREEDHRRHGCS